MGAVKALWASQYEAIYERFAGNELTLDEAKASLIGLGFQGEELRAEIEALLETADDLETSNEKETSAMPTRDNEKAPVVTTKIRRKSRRAADAKHLEHLLDLGISAAELADIFGVHNTSMNAWISGRSRPPYWTLVAAEGIRRRIRNDNDSERFFILRCPAGVNIEATKTVVRSLGATITEVK